MMIAAITSFNQDYYDRIGQHCVESWLRYWSQDITLTCYVEEFRMAVQPRVQQIDFENLCDQYRTLQASDARARVKTFAKKAYSVIHAMEHLDCDRLVWIDADTISTAQVQQQHILALCPDDVCAAFMGVHHHLDKHDPTSPLMFSAETGFFILNKCHPGFDQFRTRYREYYDQRLEQGLRRFYDGEVFGAVIKELQDHVTFRDLCEPLSKSYNSPMKHTPVGRFLTHHKSKHSKDDFAIVKEHHSSKAQDVET